MWPIQQFKLVYDRFQSSDLSVTDFCANEAYSILSFITGKRNYMSIINLEKNRLILYRLFFQIQLHKCRQKERLNRNYYLSMETPLPVIFIDM